MTAETILADSGIRLTRDARLAELRIEREARRNSLDNPALEAVIKSVDLIAASDVSACVVSSEGEKAFCAGSDLKALVAYEMRDKVHHTRLFQKAMAAIDEAPCATIAAIEGFCLGGGLELALGCDRRIASSEAVFGFPEISVGALPTGGGTLRAPRAIGLARAREMLVFAERMDSDAALEAGLISEVCAPGSARDRAIEIGGEYASKITSESVALLKDLIHNAYGSPDRATASLAAISDRLLLSTEESQDAMKAASGSGPDAPR
jgi:enoyl-CoA hydratase